MGDQYWLGGKDHDRHNEHHPGDWYWEHRNSSIQWFDWGSGKDHDRHNEHHPGDWYWEHRNSSIQWFDWGRNEPNNYGGQNCMTYMLYQDVFFPQFRDFKWNDWGCEEVAHFICEIRID